MSFYRETESEAESIDLSSSLISEDDSPRGKLKTGYYLDRKIGTGKFGAVYKGIDCASERSVAIKVVDLTKDKDRVTGFNEIETYKKLNQGIWAPNIIQYYHSFIHQDEQRLYVIMEVGKFDLFSLLTYDPKKLPFPLDNNAKTEMARQISKGVQTLQMKGIIHRDIKPENIIICKTGLKICDFGFSIVYDQLNPPQDFLGTIDYLAPEIIKCKGSNPCPYGPSVDLWALGITIYEIFVGMPLFYDPNIQASILNILKYDDSIVYPQGKVPPMPVCRLLKKLILYSANDREMILDTLGATPVHSPRSLCGWLFDAKDIFSSSE
jgi:serine/threonine protein kinase